MTVEGRALLKSAEIPVLATPRRLAAAMAMLADYSALARRMPFVLS